MPLPRAMVENQCQQLQAVLSQLLPSLQSQEERERKAAILILTEVGVHFRPCTSAAPRGNCLPNPPSRHTQPVQRQKAG